MIFRKAKLFVVIFSVFTIALLLLTAIPILAATRKIIGSASSGDLRISMVDTGSIQVEQFFSDTWNKVIYTSANGEPNKGPLICVNGKQYSLSSSNADWNILGTSHPLGALKIINGNTQIQAGWRLNTGLFFRQTITYKDGNDYYSIRWEITNDRGTAIKNLRFVYGENTSLFGTDTAAGWYDASLGKGSIGVEKLLSGQKMWLQAISETPTGYIGQLFSSVNNEINANGCGALVNVVDSNPATDNGYAFQFSKDSLEAGQTWIIDAEEHFTIPDHIQLFSVSPDNGPVTGGTSVILTGVNFEQAEFTNGNLEVFFGNNQANCTWQSTTSLSCTTPPGVDGPADVSLITSSFGESALAGGYTYGHPLTLSATLVSGSVPIGSVSDGTMQPRVIPNTGFMQGQISILPIQPNGQAYTDLGHIRLAIPKLGVDAEIVGVPLINNGWNVTWLGGKVGALYSSTFPPLEGNAVLTGHAWSAENTPGVFANLTKLTNGDRLTIQAYESVYIYEVRESLLVGETDVNEMLKSYQSLSWVTLTTCEGYDPLTQKYSYRRLVRAVLVETR